MKKLLLTTAIIATASFTGIANAETAATATVVTETHVQTKPLNDVTQLPFSQFDMNKDGSYSMPEVGEVLFNMFDTDGNQSIDNLEWNNENVMTIIPIEETTFQYVDYDSDGQTDLQINSYSEFYQASGLMAFDNNADGLSAKEFIGEGFEVLDDDENKLISLEEWKEVYLKSNAEHNQSENYNNGEKS